MKSFFMKTINLIAIIVILMGYNATASDRKATEEEVARLYAEQEALLSDDSGAYQDGIYEGTAVGFGGDVTVEVVIENGKIQTIDIVSAKNEDTAYLEMAKDIIPSIIEAQSAEVDTISGATFSSTGIKDAAAAALEKAE